MSHLVLIGLMGSGKTTVGRLVAAALRCPFLDNDAMLQSRSGTSARDIEEGAGPDVLHDQEAAVLLDALATPQTAVIAAAAGAVLQPRVVAALRGQDVVYLRATPAMLAARLEAEQRTATDDHHRPFLDEVGEDPETVLRAQFDARDQGFRRAATLTVDADAPAETVASEITSAVAR
jgi:shikimate kinase